MGYVGLPIAVVFAVVHDSFKNLAMDDIDKLYDEDVEYVLNQAAGEAFNVAYGGREYLIDIYYRLTGALGLDIEPNFGPDRAGDIKHSNADISKARELLGYDPDWNFERGINAAIEWYKANL